MTPMPEARGGRVLTLARAVRANLGMIPFELYNVFLWIVLRNQRFFDESVVPNRQVLLDRWPAMRADLDHLLATAELPASGDLDAGQVRLAAPGAWRMYFFRAFGIDIAENQQRCAGTWEVLEQVPGLYSAMFSVLEPRQRLALHTGPTKGIYRVHLGMIVPDRDRCWLEVGGEVRHWDEGGLMVFDEGYPHRAVNDTDERRVALVLDVERTMPWRWLQRLNRFVLDRMSQMDRWQEGAKRTVVYG